MASWLECSDPVVRVRVRVRVRPPRAGDIVLCSWARHFTLTVPLSTQVYKWVSTGEMLGVTLRWTSIPSSSFMLMKPETSAGLMGLLARKQRLYLLILCEQWRNAVGNNVRTYNKYSLALNVGLRC